MTVSLIDDQWLCPLLILYKNENNEMRFNKKSEKKIEKKNLMYVNIYFGQTPIYLRIFIYLAKKL